MIIQCTSEHLLDICSIINDSAIAYKGVIPADRWHEPYMPLEALKHQISEGVIFFGYQDESGLLGVMGIQIKSDVTLIRHAYVKTTARSKGIGAQLLSHLISLAKTPVLIGTWAEASWAINFYKKNGFTVLPEAEKERLLKTYWNIPQRQVETSVVLASKDWTSKKNSNSN
jgi:GNAT superfamily N-acetyltransferase